MKMNKKILVFAVMLFGMMGWADDSAPFLLDTIESLVETGEEVSFSYNSAWIGGNSLAEVVISVDGTEIKRATGEGNFTWGPTTSGKHTLTYTTYIDGVLQEEVYTATVFKDWKYTVDDGKATIVETTHKSGDVIIPSKIDGYSVVGIRYDLFAGCTSLKTIVISESVTNVVVESKSLMDVDGAVAAYEFKGTLDDGTGYVPSGNGSFATDRFGIANSAYYFNGQEQWFVNTQKIVEGTFSFAFWFRTDVEMSSTGSYTSTEFKGRGHYILFPIHGGVDRGYGTIVGTDGIKVMAHGYSYLEPIITYSNVIGSGWNHAVVTVSDNTNIKLYLNGVCVANGTGPSAKAIFRVDAGGNYGFYTGYLDDLVVCDRALDDAAVKELYSCTAPLFAGCNGIVDVTMPGGLAERMAEMFPDSYASITNVVLTGEVAQIPAAAFSGCGALESVTLAENGATLALGGDEGWRFDENGVLRSGKITDNESSSMSMTVQGEGRLTYRWKASSEYYEDQSLGIYRIYDYGYLAIDDDPKGFLDENYMTNGIAIGGHTSWQDIELDISGEGAHKIRWAFVKDEYDDSETIGEDCIWVDDIKFRPLVTLSFNLGGGVGDAPVALTGLFESFVILPSSDGFEREDHIFEGWYDGKNLYESGERYEIPKTNVVLTAQWIAKRFHTFNLNGGAGQVPAVIKGIPGTIITLPESSAFDRDYYTFVGWSDGVRTYSANATYTVGDEGVEFIAVWNPNTISAPVIVSSSVANGGILDAPSATITMSCENGANIYYTLDGSTPTAESTKYTGTFETFGLGNVTIKAIALSDNYFDSEITTFTYTRKAYTLAESINASGMNVTSTGASHWFRVLGDESYDGSEAIKSGAIGAGETSTVEMTVEGNGAISFWWKVSSHEDPRGGKFDHVAFFVDDVEVAWISGEKDWANVTYTVIGVGFHTLKWVYKKNGDAYTSGKDCAWLDEVVFEKILVAIDEPVAVEGLVYNGLEQMGVIEADGYTLSGVTTAVDAGEYMAIATLADGYKWADGSMDDRTITWSIVKAANEWITEPKISIELWTEGETAGELTDGVAKFGEVAVTINGAAFTEFPTAIGSYSIEYTVDETGNYSELTKLVTFEIVEKPNPIPAINPDWGYVVTELGGNKNEVAVVFTNHTEKAMTWSVPVNLENVQFLVVGGGGGGGSAGTGGGGGAGGGGVVTGMIYKLEMDSIISVSVGAGGAGGTRNSAGGLLASTQGGNSTLTIGSVGAITAYGGAKVHKDSEYSGGSGNGSYGAGKAGTATKGKVDLSVEELVYSVESFGNNGGYGYNNKIGGGGGGAYPGDEGRGGSATSSGAGKGGAGLVSNITGEPITYGSGGGGSTSTVGAEGGEGAGNGCSNKSAKANQGGGGGGAGKYSSGGKGGSGIVVIRYTIPSYLLPEALPEVTDDSNVAAALEGSADVKLVENIKTAAEYAAFREWALNLEGVTPEEVKASPNAWLSYALNTDKLIIAAPKEGDIVIDTFEIAATEGAFEFTVKIDGIEVGDNALGANLRKVFDIEGTETLANGGAGFSTDNVEVNTATPESGNVKFSVTPKMGNGEKPDSFFFRVRMK